MISVGDNKAFSVPENHWLLLLLGEMGTGKSQMASLVSAELARLLSYPVVVLCEKESTIKRWYAKNVPNHEWWQRISVKRVKEQLRNAVLVIEDAPLFLDYPKTRRAVRKLLSAYARENRIFTIITSQSPLGLKGVKSFMPLTVELTVNNGRYLYKIREWKKTTGWHDWTANSDAGVEAVKPVLNVIQKGVTETKALGRRGRSVEKESLRQKCIALFEAGLKPSEAAKQLGYHYGSSGYEVVQVYWAKWKVNKRNKNYINYARCGDQEERAFLLWGRQSGCGVCQCNAS